MRGMYSQEREFIKCAVFSRVAEYLFDNRLQQENEVCFIYRVLSEISDLDTEKVANSLEYQTLLFYISKYGVSPETERLMIVATSSSEITELSKYREQLCNLFSDYVQRRDIAEQNIDLWAELQSSQVLGDRLPDCSAEDKNLFNIRFMRKYAKFVRFMGVYIID
ncbi:MAG: hypothetical protein E7010_04320 [Alphaproteobacteria bacterium]|nr:hypothetical protein [Alphaproteobacteria bacterium]